MKIGDKAVENGRRRLRTGKFADNDGAHELAQRGDPSVMSIGREIAHPAQARNPHRIEHEIIGLRIKKAARRVESPRPARHFRHEEFWIPGSIHMAGAATDVGLLRNIAEDRGRIESHVAKIDEVRLDAIHAFGMKNLARLLQRFLVEFGLRRQDRLIAIHRKRQSALLESKGNRCNDNDRAPSPSPRHRTVASSTGRRRPNGIAAACKPTANPSLVRRRAGILTLCKPSTATIVLSRRMLSSIA